MAPHLSPERDDLVMGTNSSSIVSKRSVERFYYADEPPYHRYFVKKFQRRAPLINRGYHLRMHLIDSVVHAFLTRAAARPKLVINLGCGSDPLPWRTMARHGTLCAETRFVDIDFPDLLVRKREIVRQTPELLAPLTHLVVPDGGGGGGGVLLASDQYVQIGCDLRDLVGIEAALASLADTDACEVLFVAEVSITYMDCAAANALIRWAGAWSSRAEFCLLEQIIPDGPAAPFAQTMLGHFDKLRTPLQCVHTYPTTAAQTQRFRHLGWADAKAWTLWEAWQDARFLSPDARRRLDDVEVFDEWEELAAFAGHYVLLCARTCSLDGEGDNIRDERDETVMCIPTVPIAMTVASPLGSSKSYARRRFGAAAVLRDALGRPFLAHFFGAGSEGRSRSCDLFGRSEGEASVRPPPPFRQQQGGPAARSCFTLTDLGDTGMFLLAGGRASPAAPFGDAWLLAKDSLQWHRTHSLPVQLFRHAAVRLGCSQLVLVAGGKTGAGEVSSAFFVYHPRSGWLRCALAQDSLQPKPTFGAVVVCTASDRPCVFRGLLAGGLTADGCVSRFAFEWKLTVADETKPVIRFAPAVRPWVAPLLTRFGAACTHVDGWTVVAGGVDARSGSVPVDHAIVRFRDYGTADEAVSYLDYVGGLGPKVPRPVLVGLSLAAADDGVVSLVGGGLTCFSMGTIWGPGVCFFAVDTAAATVPRPPAQAWQHLTTASVSDKDGENPSRGLGGGDTEQPSQPTVTAVPRVRLTSEEHFRNVLQSGTPVVLEGLDVGRCLRDWDAEYLARQVGEDRQVVVHESTSPTMDFVARNFRYTTLPFREFLARVGQGQRLYLRALSADKPSDQPAQLDIDFPALADDFVLPSPLTAVRERLSSSVLRISGPVRMWLHYDVLANVYCQIQGSKRLYLFPPNDVTRLGFAPGSSSSSIDVFAALEATPTGAASPLAHCHPYEAVVGPGDILFLPRLWLHTAAPLTTSSGSGSVAVNVFFRDLDRGYSTGRDVYGNRDLAAYEKTRQDVAKMVAVLQSLPQDARAFYAGRLADELVQRTSA